MLGKHLRDGDGLQRGNSGRDEKTDLKNILSRERSLVTLKDTNTRCKEQREIGLEGKMMGSFRDRRAEF